MTGPNVFTVHIDCILQVFATEGRCLTAENFLNGTGLKVNKKGGKYILTIKLSALCLLVFPVQKPIWMDSDIFFALCFRFRAI